MSHDPTLEDHGMAAADRFGTEARIARLERALREHVRAMDQLNAQALRTLESIEALTAGHRQLRATLAQIQQRDQWVDAYRADTRDPFQDQLAKDAGRRGD